MMCRLNKLVLVVGELAHTINALPTPRLLGPPTLHKHLLVDSECGFQGNPDLYGLGIRLGIYLQAIATILTNAFVSEAVSDYRDNNTIFLFALLIAVAKVSANGTIQTIEGVIMLRITWAFIISAVSLYGWRTVRSPAIGKHMYDWMISLYFRLMVVSIIAIYNAWFWFRGFRAMLPQQSISCTYYVFFFARFDVFGGIQIFYKLTSVCLAILFGIITFPIWYVTLQIFVFMPLMFLLWPLLLLYLLGKELFERRKAGLRAAFAGTWTKLQAHLCERQSAFQGETIRRHIFHLARVFREGNEASRDDEEYLLTERIRSQLVASGFAASLLSLYLADRYPQHYYGGVGISVSHIPDLVNSRHRTHSALELHIGSLRSRLHRSIDSLHYRDRWGSQNSEKAILCRLISLTFFLTMSTDFRL